MSSCSKEHKNNNSKAELEREKERDPSMRAILYEYSRKELVASSEESQVCLLYLGLKTALETYSM